MSIDITQLEVVINSIINMNQKMQSMETKFQTKVDSLQEENKSLYKKIEKLSETNERNEMEKEDKNSFINKLSRKVKTNKENITKLFKNDKIIEEKFEINMEDTEYNDATIRYIEENIKQLFENGNNYNERITRLNNGQNLISEWVKAKYRFNIFASIL